MRSKKLTWPILLGISTWLVLSAVPARAGVLLSTLLKPGATISSGGLTFSNFAYSKTGKMPAASAVNVNPILVGGNYGLQFQGAFLSLPGSNADALITYKLTVTKDGPVTSALMTGNPTVVGGTGAMFVVDSFTPSDPATMLIYSIDPGSTVNSASAAFAKGLTSFKAQKDLEAISRTGEASLSFIDQLYHQPGNMVPEPHSAILAGLGIAGLAGFVWRRKSA